MAAAGVLARLWPHLLIDRGKNIVLFVIPLAIDLECSDLVPLSFSLSLELIMQTASWSGKRVEDSRGGHLSGHNRVSPIVTECRYKHTPWCESWFPRRFCLLGPFMDDPFHTSPLSRHRNFWGNFTARCFPKGRLLDAPHPTQMMLMTA